jgi:hypothetical protein
LVFYAVEKKTVNILSPNQTIRRPAKISVFSSSLNDLRSKGRLRGYVVREKNYSNKIFMSGTGALLLLLNACYSNEFDVSIGDSTGRAPSHQTAQRPGGAIAAKVVFNTTASATGVGSFNLGASAIRTEGDSDIMDAVRVYQLNHENTSSGLLASGGYDGTNWPQWLKSFQIIRPTAAPDCARFAREADPAASDQQCSFGGGGAPFTCTLGKNPLFRVSEKDCGSISLPNEDQSKGVYFLAEFSRNTKHLGENENLLVTIEYSASFVNSGPSDPSQCFNDGRFTPHDQDCSDMSWTVNLKPDLTTNVQPFLLFIPPSTNSIDTENERTGTGVRTRQFIVPLAGDPDIKYLQIHRVHGPRHTDPRFSSHCTANNSALCAGVVFHSISFVRI